MDLKKGFYRIIAKVLVWVMIVQGIPFWQLSQVYTFEFNPDRLIRTVDFLTSALLSPSSAHAGVPPDLNDYTTNKIPSNFLDISGTGTELTLSDEGGTSGVPIGFNFRFYGTIFTTITITSNGYLSFSPTISRYNTLMPSTQVPNALIAPFWDDLNPELNLSSGIFFETIGTAPNRRFIVGYKAIPLNADPDSRLTFEVVLFEGSNEIQYHYLSMLDGSGLDISPLVTGKSATVGIENADGGKGNEIAYNKAGSLTSASAFSFTLAGTAFETGRFLGDLNDDGQVNVQDQYNLTMILLEDIRPRQSIELVLSDISPAPGAQNAPFGDQTIDSDDHSRIFESIMNREELNPTLSISSFFIAAESEAVTLFGSGFDPAASNNFITFISPDGAETSVPGESVNAEGSELTITIPGGLQHPSSIRVDQNALMSNSLLFLLQGIPLISSITPDNGEEGDTITIRGYEFGATPGDNIVLFDGTAAVVMSVIDTNGLDTLVVTIPAGAVSGPLTVSVNSQPSNEIVFIYDGAPMVAITTPEDNDEIGGKVDIIGTASDLKLTYFTLELGVVNPDYSVDFSTIASGTENVIDGVLGSVDSTLMENGFYRLRLTAVDDSGKISSLSQDLLVAGANKAGAFTLNILELEVPLDGINISVNRIYDSRQKSNSQDFGRGWRVEVVKEGTYRNNRPVSEGWANTFGSFIPTCQSGYETIGHVTEIRFSDTEFYRFVPKININNTFQLGGGYCEGYFVYEQVGGIPGATLQVIGDNYILSGGGQIINLDIEPYEPENVRLTTRNGQVVDLNIQNGVYRIADANGNFLSLTDNSVSHSSGKSLNFTRDGQGRITQISDPAGNTLAYTYNADGTLASSTDRNGNTTTYGYSDFLLTDIIDPTGNTPQRNEYDADGRLVAYIDADGNRTEIDTDLDTNNTVVTDKLGNVTEMDYNEEGFLTSITSDGETNQATYDANGNKLTDTDPLGNTTTYTYDGNDTLTSQTDPLGNTISWTFNALGKVLTETDPEGNVTTRTYDISGNVLTITDPLGNVTSFTYDAKGNKLTQTDPLGNATGFEYDGFGNITKKTDPLGNETTFTYNASGDQLTRSKERTVGGILVTETTTFTYDGNGNKLTQTNPLGNTITFEYDHNNQLISETDANGNKAEYQYDNNRILVQKDYPDGTFEEFLNDVEGQRTTKTDRGGRNTFFEYDAQSRPVKTTFANGAIISQIYDAAGRLIRSTNPLGSATNHEFDAAGKKTKTTDALGNITSFSYNANNKQINLTDPNGNLTQFEYDAKNRLVRTTFDDGTFETNTYDANGNKISESDQAGNTTQYVYDALNRLVAITDALGNVTSYQYDEVGNRINEIDANGQVTAYEYDAAGRLTKTTLPLGQFDTYTYDGAGNILSRTDYNGDTTTFTYDVNNRLLTTTLSGGSVEVITYSPMGKRATETDGRGVTSYTYDLRDRLTKQTNPDSSEISYTYDLAGNKTFVTTSSGTTDYSYDALNRLSEVTDPDSDITAYAYDNVGNRLSVEFPNGNTTVYTYSSLNRLTQMETQKSDNTVIADFVYTLGPAGNRARIEEVHNSRIVDYTYDSLYRLLSENITDPVMENSLLSYTYDSVGNRLSKTIDALLTSYTYDANDQLLTEGSITYTYDQNGNMLSKTDGGNTTTYAYNGKNQLINVSGTDNTDYVYDMNNNRVKSIVNGSFITNFLVDRNREFAQTLIESDGIGTTIASYVHGDDLISQTRVGKSYFHSDGLMSTRLLSGLTGDVTDSFAYDAFGVLLARTGTTETHHLYTGQFLDPNTGFYYLRMRWLKPDIGRFITRDQFPGSIFEPQTLHKYVYTLNSPVNRIDPGGNFSMAGCMVSVSIMQILVAIAPTITIGIATAAIISTFWDLGFELRYGGLDLIMLGRPDVIVALGFHMYQAGNILIEVGAILISLTKALIDMTFGFASLAGNINGLLTSANVIQGIANGIITASAVTDLSGKVNDVGSQLDSMRTDLTGHPPNTSPPPSVKEDSKVAKDITKKILEFAVNLVSKVF